MTEISQTRPPRYHHFVLLLWEERDVDGQHVTWRFSLQDSQKEARIGFKNLEELTAFLERWMKSSSEKTQIKFSPKETNMERRIINPWKWQDEFGYVQANEVQNAQRTLYCSGQASNDADGKPMHPGDMRAQITLALDNLETLLKESKFEFKDIVRLNIFTTDVDKFLENYDVFITRLAEAGCRHSGCLVGVARLAFPEMMIEVEATAAA